jgi:hypothetical protein
MARKCSKKQIHVKSYRRSDGVKVKAHCSNKKGKKSRSRSKKSSRKIKCSPPKSQHVKSYKRSNGKRVKSHCSRPTGKNYRRFQQFQSPSVVGRQEKNCRDMEQSECIGALDQDNLRRCRVNIKSKLCEDLPQQFRKRATLQVGGDAQYVPYVAGGRVKLSQQRLSPYQ